MDKLDIASDSLGFLSNARGAVIIKITDDDRIDFREVGELTYVEWVGMVESAKHDYIEGINELNEI